MKLPLAVTALAALAQGTRLSVYRLLVAQGIEGLPAGRIATRVGVPPATLSFHLKELVNAGLVNARQDGRFVFYSADFDAMTELMVFLTDNCCAGESGDCAPVALVRTRRTRAAITQGAGQ